VVPASKGLEHIFHEAACHYHAAQIFVVVDEYFDKEKLHSEIRAFVRQGAKHLLHPGGHLSVGRA